MTRTRFQPAKLGAFVVGALALVAVAVILWGPLNGLWQRRYVIFFDESAMGLDAGATVRLNGVPIGKVTTIDLFYDEHNKVYTAVVVQLDRDKVKTISKGGQSFDDMLHGKEISAQLGIAAVISLKLYVELRIEKLEPGQYQVWNKSEYKKYFDDDDWIPAKESTIAKVAAKLETFLNGAEITNLISSVDRLLTESTSNRLVFKAAVAVDTVTTLASNANNILLTNKDQIKTTLSNLAQFAGTAGPELQLTFSKLGVAADSVQTNMAALGAGIDGMSANFSSLSTNLVERSAELGVLLRGAATLPPEAAQTLRNLQDMVDSIQRLIDYVDRHPESLLRGRAKEKKL